jgi:membrane associated rhomboid family serine protease
MSYQFNTPWSNSQTPKSIIALIFITAIATVFCAALEPLFTNIFKITGPQEFFGLSRWGLSNLYLWQPLTCLFIQSDTNGINFSFLLYLTFNMYMLWLFGSNLVDIFGTWPTLSLYFASGILASLAALMAMPSHYYYSIIAGSTASLLALFVAWAMLHRETQLLLFFLIPVKAKWLLGAVVILSFLIPLSEMDFASFVYYISAIIIGYLFSTVGWLRQSPFDFMVKIDDFFIGLGRQMQSKIRRLSSSKKEEDKIVDIQTGQTMLDDDAFVDQMLAKISRTGEKSLTWQERERMKKISEKKMNSSR